MVTVIILFWVSVVIILLILAAPVCVSGSVWAVSMAEMEHKLSVFQEVDEDIHRSIQVGQEAGEGAGAF